MLSRASTSWSPGAETASAGRLRNSSPPPARGLSSPTAKPRGQLVSPRTWAGWPSAATWAIRMPSRGSSTLPCEAYGPIDVFCSNAGYTDPAPGDLAQDIDAWRNIVDVNLLSHVWAARLVVPEMLKRGQGKLLQTISSAALITGPSGPGYTLTKHGALGFAEWLSLRYGDAGIGVTCLCPNAVYTGMFGLTPDEPIPSDVPPQIAAQLGEVLMPSDVAKQAIAGLLAGHFLVLPHQRVAQSFLRKATDYDRWLEGTRRRLSRSQAG